MAKFLKRLVKQELTSWGEDLDGSVLIDFRGLSAMETNELRSKLKEQGIRMNVVPNRLYRMAVEEKSDGGVENADALTELLKGPTAVVFGGEGAITAAKILLEWGKTHDKLEIKGGFLNRKVISIAEVEGLSRIPSKEVLLSQVVGGIAGPVRGFVGVLNGLITNLLYVIQAVKEIKEKEA